MSCTAHIQRTCIPYSGKFSRVQNFAESPMRAPEKIFAPPVRTGRRGAIDIALAAIFVVFIFAEANLSAKISCYTVRVFV